MISVDTYKFFLLLFQQVAIEDTVSSLQHVLTSKGIENNYETLEDILLVKLNSSFLNKAIDNLSLFEDDV